MSTENSSEPVGDDSAAPAAGRLAGSDGSGPIRTETVLFQHGKNERTLSRNVTRNGGGTVSGKDQATGEHSLARELIHTASWNRVSDMLDLLLAGAPVDALDQEGSTALIAASRAGSLEAVQLLLEQGAQVDLCCHRNRATPFLWAAAGGYVSLLENLQQAGCDLNACDSEGRSALHIAAAAGHTEAVGWLVARNLPLEAGDRTGDTPLMAATRNGHRVIVDFLLHHGASALVTNHQGETLLMLAVIQEDHRLMDCFKGFGVPLDAPNAEGRTAVSLAARYCARETLKWLLDAGAATDIVDKHGLTALHWSLGDHDISTQSDRFRLLLEYGADPAHQDPRGRSVIDRVRQERGEVWQEILDAALENRLADLPPPR